MMNEQKLRNKIRRILLKEAEVTRRPGRGGYKKEIQQAGALAKQNPTELMARLGISRVDEDSDIKKLNALLDQAVTGNEAMAAVYSKPQPRKDVASGAEGIRIPVRVISPRDARKYLEHTLVGAQTSRYAVFDADIQVEILGNDVLFYFADRPYSWGASKKQKAKAKKPESGKEPKQEDSEDPKSRVIGEPDFNPADEKEEASLAPAISGAITPLGTGPTYPDEPDKKPEDPAEITGRAFGGAKPAK